MADLAGRATPFRDAAVEDDSAPDTGSPVHAQERGEASAGTETQLRLDRHGDVVPDADGTPQLPAQRRTQCERLLPAGDVGNLDDDPTLRVDAPRYTDTHSRQRHRFDAGVVECLAHRVGELVQHRLCAAASRRFAPCGAEHLGGAVRDHRLDVRASEVESAFHSTR